MPLLPPPTQTAGVLCDRSGGVRALWGSYSEQISKEEQEWTAGECADSEGGWDGQLLSRTTVPCTLWVLPPHWMALVHTFTPTVSAPLPCLTLPYLGLPAAAFAPWVEKIVAEHARQQSIAAAAVAPLQQATAAPAGAEPAAAAGQGAGPPSSGSSDAGSDGSGSSGGTNGSGGGAADQEFEPVPLPPPQVGRQELRHADGCLERSPTRACMQSSRVESLVSAGYKPTVLRVCGGNQLYLCGRSAHHLCRW